MPSSGPGQVRREKAFAGSKAARTRLFNYDIGDHVMKNEHRDFLLANVVPILKRSKNTAVQLWGTASRSGSDQFNLKLSEKRANFIRDFLVQQGALREQIKFRGLGESPAKSAGIADGNESPEDRAVLVDVEPPATVAAFERVTPGLTEDGFDPAPKPPFLMVPALFERKSLRLRGGESLKLRSTDPAMVQLVDPATNRTTSEIIVASDNEIVTFEGVLEGPAFIEGENVAGDRFNLLEIRTFFPRTVDVDVYIVQDSKGRQPVNRGRTFVDTMVGDASKLFKDQANVSLRVNKFEDLKVNRDLGVEITNKETSAGKNFHVLSDMIKAPARVNLFLVWEWNPDDGNADAEVDKIGGKFIIFEDDLVKGSTPGRVLAHEIGHLFTLTHDDKTTDVLMFGGVGLTSGRLRKDEIIKARKGI
jgi:hypothetical protein